ncbi:hypothetical protein Mapa_015325 [Marchantia paleacea]|nr:hypothetical protein Mapa_015325 [Marchantia paleacea]
MTSSTPPSSGRRRRDAAHPQPLDSLGAVPSCNPLPATSTTSHLQQSQPSFNQEEPGIRLVNLLVGCADSVANKNFVLANSLLRELSIMVSPYGDTIQRVASYFTYGLAAHIAGTGSGQNLYRALGIKEPSASDTFEAFQVFCEVCPFIKFGEAATTQAVLEAFSGEENVHLIDLGMVQGSHWLGLLQGLASRNGGPPKMVHLTGVQVKPNPRSSKSISNDDQHGKQLKEFAEKLHLNFSCQLISVERLEQIQAWMLTTQAGQAIAVNCSAKMHTLLYQEHEMCINHVLSIVQSLRPKLFSLLEQEANHNVPHFLPRFLEALHFYSAMFDSLDATLTRISPERAKVEQLWLGQEIINILACEGRDRVERHERLQQWRVRMAKAGFRSLPLSDLAVLQVKTFPSIAYGTGFTVLENRGSLILSWQERPLFSCSMWTC